MFSGFLLFSHNLDFYFLNKISFSGTLCGRSYQNFGYKVCSYPHNRFNEILATTSSPTILQYIGCHQMYIFAQYYD